MSLALASSWCCGCSVETIAHLTGHADTDLAGPNAAVGGVNLVWQANGRDQNWDRHISACHLDASGALMLGTSSSDATLTIYPDGNDAHVVLNGPAGPLRFAKDACTVYKVDFGATSSDPAKRSGTETLICKGSGGTLNTTVRFHGCAR